MVRNESLRPIEQQNPATLDLHNQAVTHALEYSSALLGAGAWCGNDAITPADLALVSSLIYLNLRQSVRDWRSAHQNLAALFASVSTRPSVIASNKV